MEVVSLPEWDFAGRNSAVLSLLGFTMRARPSNLTHSHFAFLKIHGLSLIKNKWKYKGFSVEVWPCTSHKIWVTKEPSPGGEHSSTVPSWGFQDTYMQPVLTPGEVQVSSRLFWNFISVAKDKDQTDRNKIKNDSNSGMGCWWSSVAECTEHC